MPLQRQKLVNEIRKLNDETFENFSGWGSTFEACCYNWAECIKSYASDIFPTSITLEESKAAMAAFLISQGDVRGRIFEDSIHIFCSQLILGMTPLWAGVMPPLYLDLSPAYGSGISGGSGEEVAEVMAYVIHSWFLQGTAINVNTGVTINWS